MVGKNRFCLKCHTNSKTKHLQYCKSNKTGRLNHRRLTNARAPARSMVASSSVLNSPASPAMSSGFRVWAWQIKHLETKKKSIHLKAKVTSSQVRAGQTITEPGTDADPPGQDSARCSAEVRTKCFRQVGAAKGLEVLMNPRNVAREAAFRSELGPVALTNMKHQPMIK